ncbi:MAG: LuxR C-terminal-related transcriptional regulator [Flavobacteriales bacterium]
MQRSTATGTPVASRITARELEYLHLLFRRPEPTMAEIAEHMGLSVRTVEKHRDKLKRKLGAATTLELYLRAVELGLVRCWCERHTPEP